ncbi:MAG: hypothetical protein C0408_09885 [Odoribacter sp.]|nr:hypothetical protein [Odoribacter sp.]
MRRFLFGVSVLTFFLVLFSCRNSVNPVSTSYDKIKQKDDGTINLDIQKASCYNDNTNPSCNTAEWNIVVSKPGRYKVWLSSATLDTMDLRYCNTVKINLQDERLDVRPVGDKIVLNSGNVKYPYYRADSYMGTFYIQEAGEYNVQVISEKVIAQSDHNQGSSDMDHTKLMSVFLTPMTR